MCERLAALEPNGDPARDLGRVACCEASVRPYRDLEEQTLSVRFRNPPTIELRCLDVAVEGGYGEQVGKAMVGIFLRVDIGLGSELPSAGEIIGILEDRRLDAYDIGRIERVGLCSSSMQNIAD